MPFSAAQEKAAEAGQPWRLPTAEELITQIDRECEQPAVDTEVFPDVSDDSGEGAEEYWSTSPAGVEDMQATVELYIGYSEFRSPSFPRRARLVRDATPAEKKRP